MVVNVDGDETGRLRRPMWIALAVVAVAACGPSPQPTPPAASRARWAVDEPDLTIDEAGIEFLLEKTTDTGDGPSPPNPFTQSFDPSEPSAPLTTSNFMRELPVPRPPDPTPRCDAPAPGELCLAPAAPAHVERGELERCASEFLANRRLGRLERDGIALTFKGAELITASAQAMKLEHVALEYSIELTALAASAALADVAMLPLGAGRRDEAMHWCRELTRDLGENASPATISQRLTCLSRVASNRQPRTVLSSWAGCRCGARGLQSDSVCVEGISITRPFTEQPTEARLVEALHEGVRRAEATLSRGGLTLVGVGVVGCHLGRFERGTEMSKLVESPAPRLRFANVSEHGLGNACDISYAWVRDGRGRIHPFSVHMYLLALLDPTGTGLARRWHHPQLTRAVRRVGEAAFYAEAAALESPDPDDTVRHTLVVGTALRNAFVDAGLVVFAPTTNGIHWNHFHVHVPLEEEIWAETSNDATSHERRERLIAPALRRAAGLKPSAP